MFCIRKFQSTLPARGATSAMGKCCRRSSYFNPRSPHGERRPHTISSRAPYTFQSTLPARGATAICWTSLWGWIFQSTLPARGATILRLRQHLRHRISIHAPRTGSDVFVLSQLRRLRIFQSTLPARGATFSFRRVAQLDLDFNPRSPHGERLPPTCARNLWRNFNPRSPHGERQDRAFLNRRIEISIHAPRTGSDDGRGRKKRSKNLISIHAPRTGSDVVS